MAIPQAFDGGGTITTERSGSSPIGTRSPNTGSAGNTNSTYGQGAFASGINQQGTATAYVVQNTDYQGIIEFNGNSPVTVTLNQRCGTNFTCTILNLGTGGITLSPNGGLTVNGASTVTLQPGVGCSVFFAANAWTAYSGATSFPTVPATTPSVAHEWLASYNATTGAFTQTQPAFTDVSGIASVAQGGTGTPIPALVPGTNVTITGSWPDQTINATTTGLSVTVVTAALTALGTQGSMTFSEGLLVSQTPAT